MYFLIHPWGWINDKRMAVHCLELIFPSSFDSYFDGIENSKWSPRCLLVVTKWSPCGHQVVTKWSPSGPPLNILPLFLGGGQKGVGTEMRVTEEGSFIFVWKVLGGTLASMQKVVWNFYCVVLLVCWIKTSLLGDSGKLDVWLITDWFSWMGKICDGQSFLKQRLW